MFTDYKSLEELDISNWNLKKYYVPDYLFHDCKSLKEINISNWDILDIPWFNYMFPNLNKDCKIIFHNDSKFINEFRKEHQKTTQKKEENNSDNYDETLKNNLDITKSKMK